MLGFHAPKSRRPEQGEIPGGWCLRGSRPGLLLRAGFLAAALLNSTVAGRAADRESASYRLVAEGSDGGTGSGGGYVVESALGVLGTEASSASYQVQGGQVGQLVDVVSLTVSASPPTVAEDGTRQLQASATMDDATQQGVEAADVSWSVASGPLLGVDPGGLVTADAVYADAPAAVQGEYEGVADLLDLTVLNTEADNFGSYGGDGIDDDWRVFYFGNPPNPLASPGENPDRDSDTNYFEFLTGFDPTDGSDFFRFEIVARESGAASFLINKAIPERTYTLFSGEDLESISDPVTSFSVPSEQLDKPIEDPSAVADRAFYRVQISRP